MAQAGSISPMAVEQKMLKTSESTLVTRGGDMGLEERSDLIITFARVLYVNGESTEKTLAAARRLSEILSLRSVIRARWGASENNRRAKFYELTKAGQKQVRKATADWEQTTEILSRFLAPEKA